MFWGVHGPALSATLWSAPSTLLPAADVTGERLRVPTLKTPSSASAGVAGDSTQDVPPTAHAGVLRREREARQRPIRRKALHPTPETRSGSWAKPMPTGLITLRIPTLELFYHRCRRGLELRRLSSTCTDEDGVCAHAG